MTWLNAFATFSFLVNIVLGIRVALTFPKIHFRETQRSDDFAVIYVTLDSFRSHSRCNVQIAEFGEEDSPLDKVFWGLKTVAQSYEDGRGRFELSPEQEKCIRIAKRIGTKGKYKIQILWDVSEKKIYPPGRYSMILKAFVDYGRSDEEAVTIQLKKDGTLTLWKTSRCA